MKKILIATTNEEKFHEIVDFFSDLHFNFVNLKQVKLDKFKIDEPFETTWENALHKAEAYAKKSKLITIAEDTAFCVDYLNGEPGIHAKRFSKNPKDRNSKILELLSKVPTNKRQANFETHACVYNPHDDSFAMFAGKVEGMITQTNTNNFRPGMNYDSIFYYPPFKKIFSDLSVSEKNSVSHRGQTMHQVKKYLEKQFAFKQLFVVTAIIIKDRKMYFAKRRDSRPEFNRWEFPGGGVENGEEIMSCLQREIKEETGLVVEPIELLPEIMNKVEKKYNYQVFLPVYICKVKSGKVKIADSEVSEYGWFTIKEALKMNFLPLNKSAIKNNIKILKKYCD